MARKPIGEEFDALVVATFNPRVCAVYDGMNFYRLTRRAPIDTRIRVRVTGYTHDCGALVTLVEPV